ncbi:MAG: TonB-dependent receptor [Gemmatimonadetes bacterium]|nr:TonB-dependent receptor [Gemmatimonadota bacterium]
MSIVTLLAATLPASVLAQGNPLAAPSFHLDEVVVVVDRFGTPVRKSVAATSLLTRDDLSGRPARTLPDVLRSIPGIVFVERDGSGRLPMAVVRGFFGGGETSYVLLTIDGVPANDDRTGLVEWTEIPLSDVERIEVLRGSASVAYGDAALGAVVNVVTRNAAAPDESEAAVTMGSWGGMGVRASAARALESGRLRASADIDREDGYRAHSASSRGSGVLSYRREVADGQGNVFGRFSYSRVTNQEPGPLAPDALASDPLQSGDAFSADERTRNVVQLDAGSSRVFDGGRRLDVAARVRHFDQDRTRTILLMPSFGDTQRQNDRDLSVWGRIGYAIPLAGASVRLGGEAQLADYRTRYHDPSSGSLLSEGRGSRSDLAAHLSAMRDLGDRLRLDAGVRFDVVRPHEDGPNGTSPSFKQWSPRLGLNLAYSRAPSAGGNLFVTWTRAFKAPTLDQLYDVREIPTGQPGQTVNLSNAALKPQRSRAVELGLYQRVPLGSPGRFAEVSATVYRQELDDEIDFDLRTFQYGNIQQSRHVGFEGSVRAVLSPRLELTHAATVTHATFRASEYDGNQLKNIPRTAFVTSLRADLSKTVDATVTHRFTGAVYLDDENTSKVAGAGLVDAALRWRVGAVEATASVRNLFDHKYESFGYLLFDPFQQTNVRMLHPGAGRSLSIGLTVGGR